MLEITDFLDCFPIKFFIQYSAPNFSREIFLLPAQIFVMSSIGFMSDNVWMFIFFTRQFIY